MNPLPDKVHGHSGGNHKAAIDCAYDIRKYVDAAVLQLTEAANETLGAHLRGGYLREADETLETIIRFARSAQKELRIAHCPDSN